VPIRRFCEGLSCLPLRSLKAGLLAPAVGIFVLLLAGRVLAASRSFLADGQAVLTAPTTQVFVLFQICAAGVRFLGFGRPAPCTVVGFSPRTDLPFRTAMVRLVSLQDRAITIPVVLFPVRGPLSGLSVVLLLADPAVSAAIDVDLITVAAKCKRLVGCSIACGSPVDNIPFLGFAHRWSAKFP